MQQQNEVIFDLRKKLEQNGGSYAPDLSREEKQEEWMNRLGGTKLFQEKFPLVYRALRDNGVPLPENKLELQMPDLRYRECEKGTEFSGRISGFLCDTSISTKRLGLDAPRPWQRAFVTLTIADATHPSKPPYASITTAYGDINQFSAEITTRAAIDPLVAAKTPFTLITELTGMDQDGKVYYKAWKNDYHNCQNSSFSVVDRIDVSHPRYQNEKMNCPIVMLYGRGPEQNPEFKFADYMGGEYEKNNGGEAGDKDLKTLMPIAGQIRLKDQYRFIGLAEPGAVSALYRPVISINSSELVTYYQDRWNEKYEKESEQELYEKIKGCFTADPQQENIGHFDLKLDGSVNWLANVKNAAQYTQQWRTLDYQMHAAFYLIIEEKSSGMQLPLTVIIQYTSDPNVQLYMVNDGGSTVYIPAVRVHWGCLAKDTLIETKEEKKKICEIHAGDQVLTENHAYRCVRQVLIGREDTIYRIETQKGSILMTGSHPVRLSDGADKTAFDLKAGDLLAMVDGENAEVICTERIAYGDQVYALVLEERPSCTLSEKNAVGQTAGECGFFAANGFWAGDAAAQNRPLQGKPVVYTEQEKALHREFDAVFQSLSGR